MTLRCWDAVVRHRRQSLARFNRRRYYQGERAGQLAGLVEQSADDGEETWVVAHNVSFDLAVTSLPFILVDRGWALDGVHLGDESTWWVLKNDRRKIVITDSWSWVRCSLADAAKDINRRKVEAARRRRDSLEAWHKRCRVDAEILDQMMATLMDWWDENDLGVFGITGAACGWRAMTRRPARSRILVGPEQPSAPPLSAGRSSAAAKRSTAWASSTTPGSPTTTSPTRYATVAAAFPLPGDADEALDRAGHAPA